MNHSTTLHCADASISKEQEYLAGWQRARAELSNLQARSAKEQLRNREVATKEVIESLIQLADNFRSLSQHVPAELEGNPWTQGVLHIARQFQTILEDHGVTYINPQNEIFDPNKHEAVEQVADKKASEGDIIEVLQVGYALGDQILRPAQVKVAK